MLNKIIKHELKLSWKPVTILSGLIIVLALIAGICMSLAIKNTSGSEYLSPNIVLTQIASYATMGLFFSIFICFLVLGVIVYRLSYESVYGNEGYLTNVIPIKPSTLILGKFIAVMILVAIVSFSTLFAMVFYIGTLLDSFDFLNFLFGENWSKYVFNMNFLSRVLVVFLFLISLGTYWITTVFFAAAFFHTTKAKKYPFFMILAITFGIFILKNIAQSLLTGVLQTISLNLFSNFYLNWFYQIFINGSIIFAFLFFTIKFLEEKVDIS